MEEEQKEEERIFIRDQCDRLWVKNVKIRNSGESLGQRDVYIINPQGGKLRSVKELTQYILETGYFEIDPREVNFEKPDSMLGYQPTLPRVLHHNTKQFMQFITTKGSFIPNYMTRRPNRTRNTQNTQSSQNNNPPLTLSIFHQKLKNLKQCHICLYFADTFTTKKKKVFCDMCIIKSNQEKLLWYINHNPPPCLSVDFDRIRRSTAMTDDEIKAFYSDEILKRAEEENPEDYDDLEDDFDEVDSNVDNVSVASSVPSLEEKPDVNELDKAMKDNNNELANETESESDNCQEKGKTPLNGIKRSKNRPFSDACQNGSSPEKRVKIEPDSPQKRLEPQKSTEKILEPQPQPETPKEPMVKIPTSSKDADLVQLIKKEIKKEVIEEEVDEDDIPELDTD